MKIVHANEFKLIFSYGVKTARLQFPLSPGSTKILGGTDGRLEISTTNQ